MSSIKLTPVQEPTGGVKHVTPLLLPTLDKHYQVRAERLRKLAEGHAMGDYLTFTAAIARGNVMATQFHPEKSGEAGLRMLKRFAEWRGVSC